MFVRLFYTLRKYGVPVTTRELIDLNQAVVSGLVLMALKLLILMNYLNKFTNYQKTGLILSYWRNISLLNNVQNY